MKTDFLPGITSVASNALLLSSTVQLLQQVEALPSGATGALAFGEDGLILVENRRVCWAVARDMEQRLTDILCEQREPKLARGTMEELFRRCKQEGKLLGEALVSSGVVSEGELRTALERHTCEAIIRLAQSHVVKPTRFSRHSRHGYDPRFVFTTTELLASLAGRRRTELATRARNHLSELSVPDASGFAFLRDARSSKPMIIAVGKDCELAVGVALEIAGWATSLFDVTSFVDPGTYVASGTFCSRMGLLAWREGEIGYVAVCTTRPASALLFNRLTRRMADAASAAQRDKNKTRGSP
jgi:hypothetical protein